MHVKCVWDLWCKGKDRGWCQDGRQSGRLSQMWGMVALSAETKIPIIRVNNPHYIAARVRKQFLVNSGLGKHYPRLKVEKYPHTASTVKLYRWYQKQSCKGLKVLRISGCIKNTLWTIIFGPNLQSWTRLMSQVKPDSKAWQKMYGGYMSSAEISGGHDLCPPQILLQFRPKIMVQSNYLCFPNYCSK